MKGKNMDKKLTTRQEYDEVKAVVETLIAEATEKGMLEPEMDNEYTRQIAELSKQMAQYEDEYMDILPLREKTPLIRSIEDYFYARNMKQKEGAQFLGINESVFSQILSGKRRITMPLAKRLHSKLGINAEMILEYA
jgi:antitoxin component HigA of HigAB toxin-antitoxin module